MPSLICLSQSAAIHSRNLALSLGLVLACLTFARAEEAADLLRSDKFKALQGLVGDWKGVAQPQRGSTKGSWIEKASWAWKFGEKSASLDLAIDGGKLFKTAKLTAEPAKEPTATPTLTLQVTTDDAKSLVYTGALDDEGKLVLETSEAPEGLPKRISIRMVAGGDRLLVLYERKSGLGTNLVRLAEVGYTRTGSQFGKGAVQPECVVTGGYGSIQVTHNGKMYWVCCTGCQDYFNENPEQVLADYAERKAAEKKEAAQKEAQQKAPADAAKP